MEKTISELNKKSWYRFLKVIFIITILMVIAGVSIRVIDGSYPDDWTWEKGLVLLIGRNLIVLIIFEAIRRAFYYIVLGSIKPKK